MLKVEIREQIAGLVKLAIKNGVTLQKMQRMVANAYEAELCIETEQFIKVYDLQEKSIEVAKEALRIIKDCENVKRRVPQNLDWQEKFVTILAIYFEEKQKKYEIKYYNNFLKKAELKFEMSHAEFLSYLREKIRHPMMKYIEFLWKEKGFHWCGNVRTQDVFEVFYHEVMKTLM